MGRVAKSYRVYGKGGQVKVFIMRCYQDIDEVPNRMLQNDRVIRSARSSDVVITTSATHYLGGY
jgi:hypothetical protein